MSEASPPAQAPDADTPQVQTPAARPKGRKRRLVGRWSRRLSALLVAVFAALFVSLFTLDLGRVDVGGQSLRTLAEREGSKYLERPLRIGSIQAKLSPGVFVLTDVVIEGLQPDDRPFFQARRIRVHVPWWTMFRNRIELEIDIAGWDMVVERWDGRHNLPKLTPGPRDEPRGPSRFTTTVRFAHANDGTFTYDDHGAPWSVVAPNLDFSLVRAELYETYLGRARFSDGEIRIGDFLPMAAGMTTRFTLDGSKVDLRHIDLVTDGSRSHVTGALDFSRWPVQTYHVNSTVDFPRMRELFFADEDWELEGEGRFQGVFQLFRDGRDLSGRFSSDRASVNGLEFEQLHGALEWLPDRFRVLHAAADFYGGRTRFAYGIEPLGRPYPSVASFSADYAGVDLPRLLDQFGLAAVRPTGSASGRLQLAWPNGRFASRHGEGTTVVTSAARLAPAELPASVAVAPPLATGENGRIPPLGVFPMAAELRYRFEPDRLVFDPSWASTPSTYVSFAGHTSYGDDSELPFHVTSLDWQESDRLLAAIMTAFGASTSPVEVGGYGEFDGTMTGAFRAPRVAGRFDSHAMRAWDVTWGRARGDIVIEDRYLEIAGGVIGDPEGERITADGRFALGFPRDDGGDEIDARVVVHDWPLADIRHAFNLNDWPIEARVGLADLTLRGEYGGPFGAGTLRLDDGRAWGESFDTTSGTLSFEGDGVFISGIEMTKGTGQVRGSARIGWDNTYTFEADGARLPVDELDNFQLGGDAPLTGLLRFKASGASTFDHPRYQFQGTVADLFIGDEGIGQLTGVLGVDGDVLTISTVNVTEPRVQLSGSGTIALDDGYASRLGFRFLNTSIDPYLKFVGPEVSPYTGIIASGRVEVTGPLGDVPALRATLTIDEAAFTPLDYEFSTDGEARVTLEDNVVRIERARLLGLDTALDLAGGVDLGRETIDITANGDANLAILQVFFGSINASGAATVSARLQGPLEEPAMSGQATIADGNIRHFDLPHSLAAINGPIRIGGSRIDVSGLRAEMGGGDVTFGGAINLRSYRPEEFNLTASGRSMRLRYPEGFTSFVNADLALDGPVSAPRLSGTVDVLSIDYRPQIDPNAGIFGLAGGVAVAEPAPGPAVEADTYPMTFDIDIQVPRMPLIDNQTATIDGSANLRFTGTIDDPSLTGRVAIEGGQATIQGNRYTVRQGSIDFADFPRLDTVFDLEAVTRPRAAGQTYDVTVRITGTFAELTPTISSDPWLPTSDVLTLLLGGSPTLGTAEQRALESADETQARMMQTAGAVLLASPVSDRLSSVVQEVLPLETVQVTPVLGNEASLQQLDPGARIVLGKQISSRVYLTYSRVLNSTQDEIFLLEYDQNDRVSWVLSRNENQTFALDFRIRYVF